MNVKRNNNEMKAMSNLTPKILSNQIWVVGYFEHPLKYPYFTIFSSIFCVTP
jgi:hypothetical protein